MNVSENNINDFSIPKIRLSKIPRQAQIDVLEFTKKSILDNNKFTLLDCPIGSGKSYFSVMFMDWFKTNYDKSATFDILTNSKILQEQYTNEFDFMNSLWGKQSYHCETYDTDCGTGSEFCKLQGTTCESCPYSKNKFKFELGDVALTNFHLFFTYMVYMPMAWKRSSRVLIIDEAHLLESTMADFITTKISKPILKRIGFDETEIIEALSLFGTNPEDLSITDFVDILHHKFLNVAKSVMNRLSREIEDKHSVQSSQHLQTLGNHYIKWENLLVQYKKLPDNWILESEITKKYDKDGKIVDQYIEMTAQPVWAYPYMEELIWSKYDFVVCMSGTILDKNSFTKMNGMNNDITTYISLESVFPVENRPIYYFSNIGKQTYKTKEITWSKQKPMLKKILKKHKKEMGIIHSGNYEITSWIENQINDDRILTHNTNNRQDVINQHFNSDDPTVLCSPSLTTGIDLSEDFSRHQTILKMPYPNLSSKKVKRRMETMPEYYALTTIRDLIQATGRSVRSSTDTADTYILDSCFGDLLNRSRYMFPKWFLDAIIYVD